MANFIKKCGYIYLIHEREFIKTGENIFKIGKTEQETNTRVKSYPKNSELLIQIKSLNCHTDEKELIQFFTKKYIIRHDIGNEYFEGNSIDMVNDIYQKIVSNIDELKAKNEQMEQNNEELQSQNEKIQSQNKQLLNQNEELTIYISKLKEDLRNLV